MIHSIGQNETGANPELDNTKADPYEIRNLEQVNSAMIHHLQERIHAWWSEVV